MSSFLSHAIDSIFSKYDDNYISPSVKRFLSECIIQLVNVSLLSINNNKSHLLNQNHHGILDMNNNNPQSMITNPYLNPTANNNDDDSKTQQQLHIANLNPSNNFDKQLILLTEWLQNFIEPSHISMYTQTIIHIIIELQKHIIGHHHHDIPHKHKRDHPRTHSLSRSNHHSSQRSSMSITTTPTDFQMTPVEESGNKKFQRLSLFARNSNSARVRRAESNNTLNLSQVDEEESKYGQQSTGRSSGNSSQLGVGGFNDIRLSINTNMVNPSTLSVQQSNNSEDTNNSNNSDITLNWEKYEKVSMILIGSLTSILNKLLKRYNYKIELIFNGQFDKIIDKAIEFLFSRLTLNYTDKFRGIIGDCLGVLSRKYLKKICEKIFNRWEQFDKLNSGKSGLGSSASHNSLSVGSSKSRDKKHKTHELKKFAILHRAVKYLEFDIYGRNRDAAIDYLTHLVKYNILIPSTFVNDIIFMT